MFITKLFICILKLYICINFPNNPKRETDIITHLIYKLWNLKLKDIINLNQVTQLLTDGSGLETQV